MNISQALRLTFLCVTITMCKPPKEIYIDLPGGLLKSNVSIRQIDGQELGTIDVSPDFFEFELAMDCNSHNTILLEEICVEMESKQVIERAKEVLISGFNIYFNECDISLSKTIGCVENAFGVYGITYGDLAYFKKGVEIVGCAYPHGSGVYCKNGRYSAVMSRDFEVLKSHIKMSSSTQKFDFALNILKLELDEY